MLVKIRPMSFSQVRAVRIGIVGAALLVACGGDAAQRPPQVAVPSVAPQLAASVPSSAPASVAPPEKRSIEGLIIEATQTALIALNGQDAKMFASVYAENAQISVPGLNDVDGRAGVEANMSEWFQTFSKVRLGFRRVWMKDKIVVLEWVIQGKHSGELFGIKGRENPIGHAGLSIVTFNDEGKVQSERRYGDLGSVGSQLGLTKEKTETIPSVPDSTDVYKSNPEADAKTEARVNAALLVFDKKNPAELDAVIQDDVEYEGPITANTVKGRANLKNTFAAFHKAFPDAKMTRSLVMGIGDFGVVEYEMTGTQQGPIGNIKATKKAVRLHAVDIIELKQSKISRVWTFRNSTELLQQLRAINVGVVTPTDGGAKAVPQKK